MNVPDVERVRLRRPRLLQVPLELGVVHHRTEVFLGLPNVGDHHPVGGSGADMASTPGLLPRHGMLELPIVGAQQLLGISLPREESQYGHLNLLKTLDSSLRA